MGPRIASVMYSNGWNFGSIGGTPIDLPSPG